MCHELKPIEDFAFRSKKTGERQSHCRACQAKYRRQHYLDNRDAYVKREVQRIDGFRKANRLLLYQYLLSHPCVDCGENDPVVLEFDHRDPADKRSEVSAIAARKPWKFVVEEIAKCEVRCANCHRLRTASQFSWQLGAGSTWDQDAPEPVAVIQALLLPPDGVRDCRMCGLIKPLTEFSVKNKKTGRRAWKCKTCVAANSRAHYEKNRDRYLVRTRSTKRAYRKRNRALKSDVIAALACVDCGATDPRMLDFDHRDPATKFNEVSRMMSSGSWPAILSEIAKCDVRCANCHRRRTAADLGWTRFTLGRESSLRLSEDAAA